MDEIAPACTTAKSFVTVPQMSRTFTVGWPGSVLVTFTGSASLTGQTFGTGYVRLTIDNVEQDPGKLPYVEAGEVSEAHAFTWQSKPLAPGSHTARVQWRADPHLSFCLDARSLTILHR